ncbi:MAG TPA: PD-(D/E)XK nuclease family protein [Myxococcota bacterium]|nr:PD-(D/E)XK nuclease family protein [Myxococcota bacterium]
MSGVERVLEIAASTRVLRARRLHALAQSGSGALLGREFVTFRGLAERCAAETDVPVRALLGASATAELAAACAHGRGALGERLAERPALAGALAATLRDLRDAGVPPSALPGGASELAATYSAFEAALARLEKQGLFDRVGLFRLALRGARAHLARREFTRVEVHGATELVGSVGDLVEKVAESFPGEAFRFFQPDFQSEYAARLREEWSWRFPVEAVETVAQPALTPGGEVTAETLRVRRARSPRAELEAVAREVLRLIADEGVPPDEIQIVARTLDPYAPWLESTLGGYGIPWSSSLTRPAIADPALRVWLELARALVLDLPRAALVRLFDSGRLRAAPDLVPALAAFGERAARQGGVVRGEKDWRAALETLSPGIERAALARLLDALVAGAAELASARSYSAAAECLARVGAELLGAENAERVRPALAAVSALDAVRSAAGASREPTRADLDRAFESALHELVSQAFAAEDGGTVQVLDAVQARALPCGHLFLVGLVHGAWPRVVQEDPFLPDGLRETLRSRSRRPVPVSARAEREERFLLGLLLAQARERVTLSYYESDSLGRAQTPSALLHVLPFAAPGTDVLAAEVTTWESLTPDFARAGDALVQAVCAGDAGQAEAIAAAAPAGAAPFRAGRALVTHTDRMSDPSLPYDAEVGAALALPAELRVTALEELGQCPLRAFFRHLLVVRPLESPGADELEANEIGSFIHHALETVYGTLFEAGLLEAGADPAVALRRARAMLPAALESATADSERKRVSERHPTVWGAFLTTVTRALADFLERDLPELMHRGVTRLAPERDATATLRVGGSVLAVKGTIDRVVALADGGLRIGDYKTGRSFEKPLSKTRIQRGLALQLPLYARMAAQGAGAGNVTAEVLTVPLRPERDRDRKREIERERELAELETLSEPALSELGGLLDRGFYPIAAKDGECRFCDYTVACRIRHPPSRARVTTSDQGRGFYALADLDD